MLQKLPLLVWRQLVIERNQHTTSEENGIRRNQPPRLICHNDAGAISHRETFILQSLRQRMRAFFEFAVSQALLLPVAVRFDQTYFPGEAVQRILQRGADGLILGKIQHYRRD